jgi:hypothetical protein
LDCFERAFLAVCFVLAISTIKAYFGQEAKYC